MQAVDPTDPSGRAEAGEIRDAPGERPDDRPRERLARLGVRALSDREVLALVLRTGARGADAAALAERLLARGGGLERVAGASLGELSRMRGLGPAKAAALVASFDLGRRLAERPLRFGARIGGPGDVERHFLPRLGGRDRESFHTLLLDGRHRLIAEEEVSVGTLTASLVHPREVFRAAIGARAAALVLVHNHPSGDPAPSAEDHAVTGRLADAGRLLGITVVDHVIVARGGHYSFREAGKLTLEPEARAAPPRP